MLHVDFAKSYKSHQQETCKANISEIIVSESLRRVTILNALIMCNVRNDNVIGATEGSQHNWVAPMSCLQEVLHKIEHMHENKYENVYA